MPSARRIPVLVVACLALATGGCAETDRGLEAKQDVKRIEQDAQRQVQQQLDQSSGAVQEAEGSQEAGGY